MLLWSFDLYCNKQQKDHHCIDHLRWQCSLRTPLAGWNRAGSRAWALRSLPWTRWSWAAGLTKQHQTTQKLMDLRWFLNILKLYLDWLLASKAWKQRSRVASGGGWSRLNYQLLELLCFSDGLSQFHIAWNLLGISVLVCLVVRPFCSSSCWNFRPKYASSCAKLQTLPEWMPASKL